jgi:hypothetical protein
VDRAELPRCVDLPFSDSASCRGLGRLTRRLQPRDHADVDGVWTVSEAPRFWLRSAAG